MSFDEWAKRMGLNEPSFDPSLWFLALDGGQLAGVALCLYDDTRGQGWVDHLSVRRPWRNKGLGTALLYRSFQEFYARGIYTVKLSVDSHSMTNAQRLYSSVGMRVVNDNVSVFRKILAEALPTEATNL